jgi:2-polyprenyl-3-methyl-5-hydroxy-6-metoxy-1,4-benzoquinol methylase
METTLTAPAAPTEDERRDALTGRLFGAGIETLDLLCVHLGLRLGLYHALAELGPATAGQIAAATGLDARYVREWVEQQAVTAIVDVAQPGDDPEARTYALPAGHAEALLDPSSLACIGPLAHAAVTVTMVMPRIEEAFRTGEGIPFGDYGPYVVEAQAGLNRPVYENLLGGEYLPSIPDLDARLRAEPPARVLDLACGAGWSSIAIARAYPLVRVDAVDSDPASIERARELVAEAGLEDRVWPRLADAAEPVAGPYDLVTILEALHDLAHPVEALARARAALAPGGTVVVMDERVQDAFTAPGDPIERFMYGVSVLHCLPVGRSQPGSAATGTVMRTATLRRYAQEAGFAEVEVLPIEHDVFRFYRLNP